MGVRKMKAFYTVTISIVAMFGAALISGVSFTGDNIIVLGSLIAANGGMYFGANFGVHWAEAKKANGGTK